MGTTYGTSAAIAPNWAMRTFIARRLITLGTCCANLAEKIQNQNVNQ